MAKSRCDVCGATFSGVSLFDTHRMGRFEKRTPRGKITQRNTRRCLTMLELLQAGLVQNDKGWWTSGEKMPAGIVRRSA